MSTDGSFQPETAPVGYYGLPIVKAHGWKDVIGIYFFTGGLAGASSVLAAAAELAGQPRLARHARRSAMVGLIPSPFLLVADLSRPDRFLNMLRVCKPTSPMSVGTWLLSVYGSCSAVAAALDELGVAPRLRRGLTVAAGPLGSMMTTYTAVLISDTATPAWHEARRSLPFLFATSAAASAGAITAALSTVEGRAHPAPRRLAVLGALGQLTTARHMSRRLGLLDTYTTDAATYRYSHASRALSISGAVGLALGKNHRALTLLAALAVAAGSLAERLAILRAGTASAQDPAHVLGSPPGPPT